ncbi:MAG: hypothetical protein AAFP84_22250 [Actinomycetota bacterium]
MLNLTTPGRRAPCRLRPGRSIAGADERVAIDNVNAEDPTTDEDRNFVMINEDGFRVRNDPGTIESITEVCDRSSEGSLDYVDVLFVGALDDGRAVEAQIVCILQNQF